MSGDPQISVPFFAKKISSIRLPDMICPVSRRLKSAMNAEEKLANGDLNADIVTSTQKVTGIMREITVASHEQSTGVEQVNQVTGQMDNAIQENAALVEDAAAAARLMPEQAATLVQAVSTFQLPRQLGTYVIFLCTAAGMNRSNFQQDVRCRSSNPI